MIRKFLVMSKTMRLTSSRVDVPGSEEQQTVEVFMPLDIYWQAQDIIKRVEYLMANTEDTPKVTETYNELLNLLAPFVISEKERLSIYERLKKKSGIS